MGIKETMKSMVAAEQQQQAGAVAKQQGGQLVSAEAFDNLPTGYENVTAKDLIIPRLVILQGLSPQLNKNKPEFIPGAASGDFCDVATGEVWKDGVDLIPCFFTTVCLEWGPRDSGKGLVANHGPGEASFQAAIKRTEAKQDNVGKWITKDGNILSNTSTFFVLNMTAGGRRSFVPMASTQIKNARQWMTIIQSEKLVRKDGTSVTAPLFYRSWHATSVGQSNAKGDWNGWKFTAGKPTLELGGQALLSECVEFNKQAKEGAVQGSFDREDNADNESDKM